MFDNEFAIGVLNNSLGKLRDECDDYKSRSEELMKEADSYIERRSSVIERITFLEEAIRYLGGAPVAQGHRAAQMQYAMATMQRPHNYEASMPQLLKAAGL